MRIGDRGDGTTSVAGRQSTGCSVGQITRAYAGERMIFELQLVHHLTAKTVANARGERQSAGFRFESDGAHEQLVSSQNSGANTQLPTDQCATDELTLRKCRTCGQSKPLDEFYRHPGSSRRQSSCKACQKRRGAEWRQAHKGRHRDNVALWKSTHREQSDATTPRAVPPDQRSGCAHRSLKLDAVSERARRAKELLNARGIVGERPKVRATPISALLASTV